MIVTIYFIVDLAMCVIYGHIWDISYWGDFPGKEISQTQAPTAFEHTSSGGFAAQRSSRCAMGGPFITGFKKTTRVYQTLEVY